MPIKPYYIKIYTNFIDNVLMCLKIITKQKSKTPLEQIEDIEILRFLEMGYDVRMIKLSGNSFAVDNLEDLERVREYLRNKNKC